MANGLSFASNPGASKWITTTPSSGVIRQQLKDQKKQELLSQAASMTPDQEKLYEQLTSRELSPVDRALFGNMVNAGLGDYFSKYNENPYYAFSREGIGTVRNLQQVVRDPRIIAAERAYKLSEENYKKASDAGLGGLVQVQGGKMAVIDQRNGETMFISPDVMDENIHAPVRTSDQYDYLTGVKGFYNEDISQIKPFTTTMEDPEKVIDQVNKWFSGLGQNQREEFDQLLTSKTTTNTPQIRSRLDAILSTNGLPESFRDTIYAQYYTNELEAGRKPTRQGAKDALYDTVGKIAGGYNVFKQDLGVSPTLQAAKTQKEAMIPTTPWILGVSGADRPQKNITVGNNRNNLSVGYWDVDKSYLNKSQGAYKDEDGKYQPKRNMKDMSLFKKTGVGDWFIPDLTNAGKLVPMPESVRRIMGEVVVSDETLGDTFVKEDGTGTYVDAYPGVDSNNKSRAFITTANLQGKRDITWEDDRYRAAFDALADLGYTDESVSDAQFKEYKNHVNNPDYNAGSNPWETMYNFQIFTKYNPDAMRDLDGAPVGYENKTNITLPNPTAMQSTNPALDGNYFTKGKALGSFDGFGDLK